VDEKRTKLWRSTDEAHRAIQLSAFELQEIASRVDYLHPTLAEDLWDLARKIEKARKQIQGDAAEMINLDLKHSQTQMGNIFKALLDNAER